MIPNKLYIPTTTLNFNNIMASESISPARFYSVRGFGYNRFDKVEPNNLDNRIILYENFPVFNINDKELENYPLVIEIDTKTVGKDIIQEYKNNVYYSEETIYLNPFSTQFIFNNEIEKRHTLSKVEQSLNTKMTAIYRNCIVEKAINIERFEWKDADLTDSKDDFSKHISKDRKINKLKGFLYAYLLGANKLVSENVVFAKKRTKYFRNELSALVSSLAIKGAEEIINCLDSFVNDINGISDKIKTDIKDLPILQHGSRVESVQKNNFLPELFNEYLAENWNSEEFISGRLEFATAGGRLFKKEMQDKWEKEPDTKNYINALRNNLASHTAFSLQNAKNLTLKSFAAFCQKGDNIDKLEDYLISNEIGDFRIAFALWGIVFGFANMPKTLTNDLFLLNDIDYISDIYKYIFNQVHGIELEGKLERKQEEEFVTVSSKMNEEISIKIETEKEKRMSTKQQANEIEIEYREKLKQVSKATKSQIDSVIDVLKNNHFVVNSKLFDTISKIDNLGKRTNAFKAIKECLQPENLQVSNNSNDLFLNDTKPDKEFYKDTNVLSFLKILKKEQKKVREEIEWIQKVHKEGGYKKQSGEWVELTDHTNAGVIRHFENNSKSRIDSTLLTQIVSKLKTLYL
jgi:hypothetical protein